jgi:hypothetical protein
MKRVTMAPLLLATGLLLASAGHVRAAAWSQSPGGVYAKLSGISYDADRVYNAMGRRQAMGINDDEFRARQMFLYVEYGLRERLTLITQARAGVLTDEDTFVRRETTGIGDLEVGLKYQSFDRPVVIAPQLMVKLPTGYDDAFEPSLGTGDADVDAKLLLSRSLYPLPLYGHVEGGYRLRGGPFSNQWLWAAEVGVTPHERLFGKLFVSGIETQAAEQEADELGVVGASTQVSEGDLLNVGVNLAVQVGAGLWLDLLWERAVDGENIGAGSSVGLGLSMSR